MFAINAAMATVPDISEATVIKFLQSKGLRPEGTSGGKMAQKTVFIGGRMGEQWTKGREQLGGRAMQPAP